MSNEEQAVYGTHEIFKAYYKVAIERSMENGGRGGGGESARTRRLCGAFFSIRYHPGVKPTLE